MKTDPSVTIVPDTLPRGVHRERSTYAGYVSYKAVTASGVIAGHLILMEALDRPDGRDMRYQRLWAYIEEAETLTNHPPPLHIVA